MPLAPTWSAPGSFPTPSAWLCCFRAQRLVSALRGRLGAPEEGEDVDADAATDWVTLAKIALSFAAHIAVVDVVGWALAGALLFTLVAWSLGAKVVRAAVAGVIIGFTVQALFVTALGVTLPAGPFEGVSLLDG